MSRYSVTIKEKAAKYLATIPKKDRLRIIGAIDLLSENPLLPKTSKLKGREGHRIRIGDYRIIYSFNSNELTILIIKIGHRRDIYQREVET